MMPNGKENPVVVYMVRHGESQGNTVRKVLPPSEDVLTDNGKLQAKLLGHFLQVEKFTKAISSDYPRCVETASIILEESGSNVLVEQDRRLRECDMGKYQNGGDIQEMVEDFVKSGKQLLDWTPEGGENRELREKRTQSFLDELFKYVDEKASDDETVLVLSHGTFLYQMWSILRENAESYHLSNWRLEMNKLQRNTGFFKVHIQRGSPVGKPRMIEIITAHGNEHLKPLLESDALGKYAPSGGGKKFQGCVHQ